MSVVSPGALTQHEVLSPVNKLKAEENTEDRLSPDPLQYISRDIFRQCSNI